MNTEDRAAAIATERARMQAEAERRAHLASQTADVMAFLRDRIRERREQIAACELAAESEPCSDPAMRQMRRAGRLTEDVDTLLDAISVLQYPGRTWPLDEE